MAEQRTASLVVCIDATSLAVLQLSREGASRWAWPDSSPLRPTGKPGPARKAALDRSRRELEAEAVAEFAEAGGGTSAESLAWRQVFVRRRLALVVSGALGALSGVAAPEPESATAALTRKKDAPEHGDAEGVRRFLAAQAEQSALADRRCARGRPRRLVASAARPLQGGRCCWEAPASAAAAYAYGLRGATAQPRRPLLRVVVDDLASAAECRHAVGACVLGLDPHRIDKEDDAVAAAAHNGEQTLVASPPSCLRARLGEGAARLVALLLGRVAEALRSHWREERPLYLAGALLTRLQPPPPPCGARARGERYEYSVAHVDRANVASYDYSAVLYLNSKGEGFEGGDFCFVDAEGDEVLEPRAGRCVLFSSGFEHLHRVEAVRAGSRFALATWFTLTAEAADGAPLRSEHYALVDPLPPPTAAELAAETTSIDGLRARIEKQFG